MEFQVFFRHAWLFRCLVLVFMARMGSLNGSGADPARKHPLCRASAGDSIRTRIEREGRDFRQRVLDGYRIVARKYPNRVLLLDGTRPAAELHEEIRGRLREHL